ncbi:MAG: glycoside hydrolase 100 family protein [Phycisphaeraceae bacterium]
MLLTPDEQRNLTEAEQEFISEGYQAAVATVKRNVTPLGFSACSLADNEVFGTDVNYRSVWARDGAMSILWTIDLEDEAIVACQAQTLRTLIEHQSPGGQIPACVGIDTGEPEYSGVGGIASIDSPLWLIIAVFRYAQHRNDWSIIDEHREELQKTMDWLSAHDSNNCGLLEVPEASDWTDLFGRSYHVLYDEVLWYHTLYCYTEILRHYEEHDRADDYNRWAEHVRRTIIHHFWPATKQEEGEHPDRTFAQTQYALGDARYLLAQITPFSFSWRCDVFGNLLAYLMDIVDHRRAMMTFRFLWGVGISEPAPVKNIYPPVQSGDPEWRQYYTVNLLNLPDHYHNGGIWPFVGGIWVRYLHKLGMTKLARRELVRLAELCHMGTSSFWEFSEWHHGHTGRPMGKVYQTWSAASFIRACHVLELDADSIKNQI